MLAFSHSPRQMQLNPDPSGSSLSKSVWNAVQAARPYSGLDFPLEEKRISPHPNCEGEHFDCNAACCVLKLVNCQDWSVKGGPQSERGGESHSGGPARGGRYAETLSEQIVIKFITASHLMFYKAFSTVISAVIHECPLSNTQCGIQITVISTRKLHDFEMYRQAQYNLTGLFFSDIAVNLFELHENVKKYFELEPLARGKRWILEGSTADNMEAVKEIFGQFISLLEDKDTEPARI
ncbi:ADP-ribosylation factor-like protein 15 [Collichthys lucidus]|uniref:ADP-ribosylation factor-like protein 15 n=1 Tax=Collichthys lucidus TaxID=240159 RepID=A0A4U5UT78_COLLU|nr:ADP-ribosylation factor-like protein 15 [Collichthys lucidus]